jgi:hypothetical protein
VTDEKDNIARSTRRDVWRISDKPDRAALLARYGLRPDAGGERDDCVSSAEMRHGLLQSPVNGGDLPKFVTSNISQVRQRHGHMQPVNLVIPILDIFPAWLPTKEPHY